MKKIITALAILGLVGCGGGSNNDQGTSLTLLGYSTSCTESPTEPNLVGVVMPLSTDTEAEGSSGTVQGALIIANRLTEQFVRTENAFFDYFIPGASSQPPSTAVPAGLVIAQAAGEPGGAVTPSTGCVGTFLVPAEIRQWMVLNRNFLPELPFTMEGRGYVTGISQAGDRFDTNEVKFIVQVTPDVVIPPSSGEGTDGGEAASAGNGLDQGVDVEDGGSEGGSDL